MKIQQLDNALERMAADDGDEAIRSFGDYTLAGVLGRRGDGTVYKAVHGPSGREVALTLPEGGRAAGPEQAERFGERARVAARVQHDHAVPVHDGGVCDGRLFLAAGFVDGVPLADVFGLLSKAGPPPFGFAHHRVLDELDVPGEGEHTAAFVRRVARLLAGPADALRALHEAGLAHGEVGPDALLLVDGRLVLAEPALDAGDEAADVAALGRVLFEALTQRTPDADPKRAAGAARLVPGLPPAAARVLAKALERRLEDRYASAEAFAADLAALASGGAVAARKVTVTKRAARFGWGAKWAVLAILVVAGFCAWLFTRPATLHFTPRPHADVWLGDTWLGRSPLAPHELPAGQHVVRVERPGFKPEVFHVDVSPGGSELIEPRLVVVDAAEPQVREAFYEQTGVRVPAGAWSRDDAPSAPNGAALPLFPRGDVRRSDLTTFAAEVYEPARADVVFLDAEGREVVVKPGLYAESGLKLKFSDDDRAALETGKTYRWGLRIQGRVAAQAEFTVVADFEKDRLLKVRDVVTHPKLRDLFEIGFLAKEGLHTAAFRQAYAGYARHRDKEFLVSAWHALKALDLNASGFANTLWHVYSR